MVLVLNFQRGHPKSEFPKKNWMEKDKAIQSKIMNNFIKDPAEQKQPDRIRFLIWFCFFLTIFSILVIFNNLWPYFYWESKRMPLWEAIFIWIGDFFAFLWFIHHFVNQGILGIPLKQKETGLWKRIFLIFFLSFSIDFVVTTYSIFEEWKGFNNSIKTTAQVQQVYRKQKIHQGNISIDFKIIGSGSEPVGKFL